MGLMVRVRTMTRSSTIARKFSKRMGKPRMQMLRMTHQMVRSHSKINSSLLKRMMRFPNKQMNLMTKKSMH